jgi:hypothetical protein
MVSDSDWLLPTVTLPKLSLEALAESRPLVVPVPVPANKRVAILSDASLEMKAEPLKVPGALGVNPNVIEALLPARIVIGRLVVLREKYWLEIDALLTVIEALPVFDAVTVSVLLVPAVTLPKSRLALLRARVPD